MFKSGSTPSRDASRSLTTRCCCVYFHAVLTSQLSDCFDWDFWDSGLTGKCLPPRRCPRSPTPVPLQRSKLNLKAVFFPTMPQTLRKDCITVYYYPSTRILNSHWNRFIWATGPRHQHRCHSETEHDISLRSLSRIVLRSYGRTLKYILI